MRCRRRHSGTPADLFVGVDLGPHVGEHGDHVFEPPEEVIGVVERLPGARIAGIALLADEPWLPGRDGGDTGKALRLARRSDRVGRLGRRGNEHQAHLVFDDELLRDLRGAVGIGLTVLDHHFYVEAEPLGGFGEAVKHKGVRFGKGGERPGLRTDIADLCGFGGRQRGHGQTGRSCDQTGRGHIPQQSASCDHFAFLPMAV